MTANRLRIPNRGLDLLILKAISIGPRHGCAIYEWIHAASGTKLQVAQGSLYPALHRIEQRGWAAVAWGASDHNRRAKFYKLTRSGRRRLEAEAAAWNELTAAFSLAMGTT